jgi:hypothetical protein
MDEEARIRRKILREKERETRRRGGSVNQFRQFPLEIEHQDYQMEGPELYQPAQNNVLNGFGELSDTPHLEQAKREH